MKNENVESPYLSVKQAAEYCGISLSTINQKIVKKEVAYSKFGRLIKFTKPQLDAWVQSNLIETKNKRKTMGKIRKAIVALLKLADGDVQKDYVHLLLEGEIPKKDFPKNAPHFIVKYLIENGYDIDSYKQK